MHPTWCMAECKMEDKTGDLVRGKDMVQT
jgi:hypothetical protein